MSLDHSAPDLPEVAWRDATGEHRARWLSPVSPPPARAGPASDATTAAAALARTRDGEALIYEGDHHNARQLLAAMGRRLFPPRRSRPPSGRSRETPPAPSPEELRRLFLEERRRTRLEHEVLSRLLVPFGTGYTLRLRRAPDVSAAVAEALGPPPDGPSLLPLRDLLGMVGAHEWRRRGVEVPALGARLYPHFGVYAPIRGEYVGLAAQAAARWPMAGRRVLDVGTGTGVLALLLAQGGARVTATDVSPRAVACARAEAARLGLAVEVLEADLLVGGGWDLVVSNPPWLPAEAHTLLDQAVYDPGGRFLSRLVEALPAALAPGGEAWIIVSDLAERLGLRAPGTLERLAGKAGLRVDGLLEARPTHPRASDAEDPLHAARSREVTRLIRLVRA